MKPLSEHLNNMNVPKIEEGQSDILPESNCPNKCTRGWVMPDVPMDDPRRRRLIPCTACEDGQANLKMQWERRMKSAELPVTYRNASIESWAKSVGSFIQGKVLAYLTACEFIEHSQCLISSHRLAARVKNYMDETPDWVKTILTEPELFRIGFVLQGEVGTGKTWLAAAVMNALVDMGHFVLYMRAQDIIQSLKETWNKDEGDAELLSRYKTVPFLFIDDMNLELRGNQILPYQKDYMEAIIRYRSNHRLSTFITCNITLEQFYEQWGARIADVVAADLQWVKMGGAKLRQSQQQWGEL